MAALDSSVINVSMPTITEYFNSDMATTNWVVTIYLLTLSGLLVIFGKLSDMLSRKRMFTAGMAVFTLTSVMCALAGSLQTLIVARFFQALGGAMIMANSPAIITDVFPAHERGKALGTIGTVVALGIMTGAPLGGQIVSTLSWRYIFYINIPVGIVGIAMCIMLLTDSNDNEGTHESFDFLGAVLLIIFMVTFLIGMNLGAKSGFLQRNVYALFAISIICFALFIVTEIRVKSPTIDLKLFKNAGFSSSNMSALLSYMTIFMMIFTMPFYLERVQGLGPAIIGGVLTATTVMLLIFSPIFGLLSDKIGYRLLRCIGLTLMAGALFLMSRITETTTLYSIVGTLFFLGFGTSMFTPANNSLIMGSVPKNKLGVAAGMLATTRNMGMMLGVASASAIFTYRLKHYAAVGSLTIEAVKKMHNPYSDVFLCATFVCIVGIVVAYLQGQTERLTS